MDIEKLIENCLLDCQEEAVRRNFPQEAGEDMFWGIIRDDTENWDERQFIAWTLEMDRKYDQDSNLSINPLFQLYQACAKILNRRAKQFYHSGN